MRSALIISVARYDEGYPNNIYEAVVADVSAVTSLFKRLGIAIADEVGRDGVSVSYTDIKKKIASYLTSAQPGDDLVVYYTGHGIQSEGLTYLVPSDADPSLPQPKSYLVPVSFLEELERSEAKSVTFIIDACRSGNDDNVIAPDSPSAPASMRVTYVFATRPGDMARTGDSLHAGSLFTQTLCSVLPTLSADSRVSEAEVHLQSALAKLCQTQGHSLQTLDIVTSGNKRTSPFPLFATNSSESATDRWSRLITANASISPLAAEGAGPSQADSRGDRLLSLIDQIEHSAPDIHEDSTGSSPWADNFLLERLTRALAIVRRAVPRRAEWLALIGVTAVLEASFREAEHALLMASDEPVAYRSVLLSEPVLARSVSEARGEERQILKCWVKHLASVRESVTLQSGGLDIKLAELASVLSSDSDLASVQRAARQFTLCVRSAFDAATIVPQTERVYECTRGKAEETLDLRRLAALLQLTWQLSLDSRLFAPDAGVHLYHDQIPVHAALASLGRAVWVQTENVLDLDLHTESAPLDRALRQVTGEITETLLRHTQLGAALYGSQIPLAAVTTRLKAEDDKYKVPHISFSISPSETQALLMGSQLYGDVRLAIRELYQNAADACHYREQRLTHASHGRDTAWRSEIRFETGRDEQGRRYIDCTDNGVGMGEHELREAFARTGRRFRDLPEYVEESQEWQATGEPVFTPISQFGIGVLSYFMIADSLELWTTRVEVSGATATPLHVRVHGEGGLFQVQSHQRVKPDQGGTTIRLRLRSDHEDFDLHEALSLVLRVPEVDVVFIDEGREVRWARSVLHHNGEPLPKTTAEGRVWFHEGPGEILVNGLPVDNVESTSDRPRGFSVSLNGTEKPELSVDRRRLLAWDKKKTMDIVVKALPCIAEWPDVTANWLIDLFNSDVRLGCIAYKHLADKKMRLEQEISSRSEVIELIPRDQGLFIDDPLLFSDVMQNTSLLHNARLQSLEKAGVNQDRPLGQGFPPFDEKLLALMSFEGGFSLNPDFARDVNRRKTREAGQFRNELWELAEVAEALGLCLGSVSVFAWAVAFMNNPAGLRLSSVSAKWTATRNHTEWTLLRSPQWRRTQVVSLNSYTTLLSMLIHWNANTVAPETAANIWPDSSVYFERMKDLTLSDAAKLAISRVIRRDLAETTPNVPLDTSVMDELNEVVKAFNLPPGVLIGHPDVQGPPLETDNAPSRLMSRTARVAVSRDYDALNPFISPSTVISPLRVLRAARRDGVDYQELLTELRSNHYEVGDAKFNLELIGDILTEMPTLRLGERSDGEVFIEENVSGLERLLLQFGPQQMMAYAERLSMAGVPNTWTMGTIDGQITAPTMLQRHLEAISPRPLNSISIGLKELINLAHGLKLSFREAIWELSIYKGLVKAWSIPDNIPNEVLDMRPGFKESVWMDAGGAYEDQEPVRNAAWWLMRGLHASAATGDTIADLLKIMRPLLLAFDEDTELLDAIADEVSRPVDFDDLLIIGVRQFSPPIDNTKEIVAMCSPVAAKPEELLAKVELWKGFGINVIKDAWTLWEQ